MAQIFHIAFAVPRLEETMKELSDAMGVQWRNIYGFAGKMRDEHGVVHEVDTRLTFSTPGPTVIELFEENPGTPLAATPGNPFHHVGVWAEDFWSEEARLDTLGWPCCGVSPDRSKPTRAGFFRGPSNITFELCTLNTDRPLLRDLYPPDSPFFGVPEDRH